MLASEHPGIARVYPNGTTHVVTIPGTAFKAFLGDFYMLPQNGKPAKVDKFLKDLSRTTVGMVGRRKVYAQPVITELPSISQELSNVA